MSSSGTPGFGTERLRPGRWPARPPRRSPWLEQCFSPIQRTERLISMAVSTGSFISWIPGAGWEVPGSGCTPPTAPPARAWAVVGLDLTRKIVILSGGLGDVRTDNTWTWDGVDWTQRQPATALPKIFDSAAAFDFRFHVVVVFGGDDGNGPLDTSWAWTGSNWLLGQTVQSPPARELHGMAYDFATDQLHRLRRDVRQLPERHLEPGVSIARVGNLGAAVPLPGVSVLCCVTYDQRQA